MADGSAGGPQIERKCIVLPRQDLQLHHRSLAVGNSLLLCEREEGEELFFFFNILYFFLSAVCCVSGGLYLSSVVFGSFNNGKKREIERWRERKKEIEREIR